MFIFFYLFNVHFILFYNSHDFLNLKLNKSFFYFVKTIFLRNLNKALNVYRYLINLNEGYIIFRNKKKMNCEICLAPFHYMNHINLSFVHTICVQIVCQKTSFTDSKCPQCGLLINGEFFSIYVENGLVN